MLTLSIAQLAKKVHYPLPVQRFLSVPGARSRGRFSVAARYPLGEKRPPAHAPSAAVPGEFVSGSMRRALRVGTQGLGAAEGSGSANLYPPSE